MDTNNTAQVEGDYTSLPFGDGFSVVNTDDDTYHFAGMDYDYNSGYSGTAHAQFRQYNNGVGSWMSPDRYSGSYDFGNPQSLNRYAYVGNNPLSATDPSGLVENNGGGPGDGDWCDATDPTCDPGGCDPLFYDCNGYPGYGDGGSWEAPEIKGYIDLDPHHIMTESLGLPAGMQLPSGDILDIFGIGSGTCEFGACGPGPSAFGPGDVEAAAAPITLPAQWLLGLFAMVEALHPGLPKPTMFKATIPGTNYCGPGGNGTPTNQVDRLGCAPHDLCYQNAGVSFLNNIGWPKTAQQSAAIRACDANLCGALSSIYYPTQSEAGQATLVSTFFGCSGGYSLRR